jgi:uncharacterized membrane protein
MAGALLWGLAAGCRPMAARWMGLIGSLAIVTWCCVFCWPARCQAGAVYEAFVEGAKDGFGVAVNIIPYLVAMLVAICGVPRRRLHGLC